MKDQLEDISFRWAEKADMPVILSLIHELAIFEKSPEEVTISLDQLTEDWDLKKFVCIIAVPDFSNEVYGMALCYERYSTWKGLSAHLEDLIVRAPFRGRGVGGRLMEAVIQWARSIEAKRLHWEVLDWNSPAISFYESIGSEILKDWYPCRLSTSDLNNYSYKYPPFIYS
ncbi:MAG: Uncharacterised protein [Owenweeksia sp. TMED14]|nr:MAG: Uncharacterised protein [Owenweeksia sp. TMED14]|tara:strand:+ start:5012 stop:5524 length:513 start_codon:yes stop_codon:yes gene_type:complete